MSSTRIMIDGYNLALERGTGVATYSRNLALELSKLGHKIDLLYGVRASTGKHALMSEVNFFDPSIKGMKTAEVVKSLFKSPLGLTAREVPITGRVIAKNPVRVLPPYDRIFNSPPIPTTPTDVFAGSQRQRTCRSKDTWSSSLN